ncbi:ATP-dependent DNA helicase Pif1-like [Rhizophagus clarus]|uniref:ATP-dependent DNA helicase n=1 Tax=Rhizophagus clarus TaxID=94130 RepID=A0A8H3QKT7_9GLOM|nr:ATP-dependent DNA helicase Pif1-like [Rhizophagus clarus]
MVSQRGFKTDSQHTCCVAIYFKVCKQSRIMIGSLFRRIELNSYLPLNHSSRQFVFLNLNKEALRWICDTGENEESFKVNESGRTEKSPLKAYWDRPTKLENFTLFWLHLIHKLVKGSRDIDQNHDWINDLRQRYSDTELVNIDMFVSRNCRINAEKENIIVDYQMLNSNQKIIFKRIESHYNDVLNGHQIDPLRIIVMGTAGTGKTYLIKAIRGRLQEMVGTGSKLPIIVLAPTGVAAFNIDGRNNEPFGGRSVILFGDFGQLPPVLDLSIYADDKWDALSNSDLAVYKQFKEAYKLEIIQRQSGNSKEQQELRDVPVAKIQAIHTGSNEAKKADSDTAHGLEACILLARGA